MKARWPHSLLPCGHPCAKYSQPDEGAVALIADVLIWASIGRTLSSLASGPRRLASVRQALTPNDGLAKQRRGKTLLHNKLTISQQLLTIIIYIHQPDLFARLFKYP
jgi:hypothetical protein